MNRREVLQAGVATLVASLSSADGSAAPASSTDRVERWDVFELTLSGPKEGNPFLDTWLKATFRKGARGGGEGSPQCGHSVGRRLTLRRF